MTIRTYVIGNTNDQAQLRKLHYDSQVYQHVDIDGVTQDNSFDRRVTDSFDENIVQDDTVYLVLDSDRMIGFIQIRLPRGDKIAWVDDLYVEPGSRRQGYARKLIRACEQLLREHGAKQLRIFTQAENDGARMTYSKAGYEMVEEEDSYVYFKRSF